MYREHPELARYYVPPLILTALLVLGAVLVVLRARGEILAWALPAAPTDDGVLASVTSALLAIAGVLVIVVLLGVAMIAAMLVAQLVAAPFHDALSAAVERVSRGQSVSQEGVFSLLVDAWRSVWMALLKLAIYAGAMGLLLLLGLLLPVVGPVLQAGFGFLLTASFLALDHLDWAAARHGMSVRERVALLRKHPSALLGFGSALWVMLFVPVLNLLLMPAAVAGGTLLFGDLQSGLGAAD